MEVCPHRACFMRPACFCPCTSSACLCCVTCFSPFCCCQACAVFLTLFFFVHIITSQRVLVCLYLNSFAFPHTLTSLRLVVSEPNHSGAFCPSCVRLRLLKCPSPSWVEAGSTKVGTYCLAVSPLKTSYFPLYSLDKLHAERLMNNRWLS